MDGTTYKAQLCVSDPSINGDSVRKCGTSPKLGQVLSLVGRLETPQGQVFLPIEPTFSPSRKAMPWRGPISEGLIQLRRGFPLTGDCRQPGFTEMIAA